MMSWVYVPNLAMIYWRRCREQAYFLFGGFAVKFNWLSTPNGFEFEKVVCCICSTLVWRVDECCVWSHLCMCNCLMSNVVLFAFMSYWCMFSYLCLSNVVCCLICELLFSICLSVCCINPTIKNVSQKKQLANNEYTAFVLADQLTVHEPCCGLSLSNRKRRLKI